jgi:hypothetical protein
MPGVQSRSAGGRLVSLSAAASEGMLAALEADLFAHPDDLARHGALADTARLPRRLESH